MAATLDDIYDLFEEYIEDTEEQNKFLQEKFTKLFKFIEDNGVVTSSRKKEGALTDKPQSVIITGIDPKLLKKLSGDKITNVINPEPKKEKKEGGGFSFGTGLGAIAAGLFYFLPKKYSGLLGAFSQFFLRKNPLLNFGTAMGRAYTRFKQGDILGALSESLLALLSFIPGPIGTMIRGGIGVILGLRDFAGIDRKLPANVQMKMVKDYIMGLLTKVAAIVKKVVVGVGDFLQTNWPLIKKTIGEIGIGIWSGIKWIITYIAGLFGKQITPNMWKSFEDKAIARLKWVKDKIKAIWAWFGDLWDNVVCWVNSFYEYSKDGKKFNWKGFFKDIQGRLWAATWWLLKTVFGGIWAGFTWLWEKFIKWVPTVDWYNVGKSIRNWIIKVWTTIEEWWDGLPWAGIGAFIGTALAPIIKLYDEHIKPKVDSLVNTILSFKDKIVDIFDTIEFYFKRLGATLDSIPEIIENFAQNAARDATRKAIDAIPNFGGTEWGKKQKEKLKALVPENTTTTEVINEELRKVGLDDKVKYLEKKDAEREAEKQGKILAKAAPQVTQVGKNLEEARIKEQAEKYIERSGGKENIENILKRLETSLLSEDIKNEVISQLKGKPWYKKAIDSGIDAFNKAKVDAKTPDRSDLAPSVTPASATNTTTGPISAPIVFNNAPSSSSSPVVNIFANGSPISDYKRMSATHNMSYGGELVYG